MSRTIQGHRHVDDRYLPVLFDLIYFVWGQAWCPFHSNLLASGGGTADRRICLWNTGNGQCLNEVLCVCLSLSLSFVLSLSVSVSGILGMGSV